MSSSQAEPSVISPVILSASRSTDIPAFYSEWFASRLKAGCLLKKNPFNNRVYKISLEDLRFVVFWTKNPEPLLRSEILDILDDAGIGYYFQFTLNDYDCEGIERNVPPVEKRIAAFKELSDRAGKDRVVWRFDPLMLSDSLTQEILIRRIEKIAGELEGYTERLVFSFFDEYKSVRRNLNASGFSDIRGFTDAEADEFARRLYESRLKDFGIHLFTCGEPYDFSKYGIGHSKCIDGELIMKISADPRLCEYIRHAPEKDKSQRPLCGCIPSTDTGGYNTCPHMCAYCYANHNPAEVRNTYNLYRKAVSSGEVISLEMIRQ